MMRNWISWVAGVFLLLPGLAVGAQQSPQLDEPVQSHPDGEAAIDQLLSPYCPGMMLEICPSPQAKMLRDTLQAMAWSGAETDSIVGWMLANHGEEYRAVPQIRGSGLWAWIMPFLALIGGLVGVSAALRHFREGGKELRNDVGRLSESISPEDESTLEAALAELKASEEVAF